MLFHTAVTRWLWFSLTLNSEQINLLLLFQNDQKLLTERNQKFVAEHESVYVWLIKYSQGLDTVSF